MSLQSNETPPVYQAQSFWLIDTLGKMSKQVFTNQSCDLSVEIETSPCVRRVAWFMQRSPGPRDCVRVTRTDVPYTPSTSLLVCLQRALWWRHYQLVLKPIFYDSYSKKLVENDNCCTRNWCFKNMWLTVMKWFIQELHCRQHNLPVTSQHVSNTKGWVSEAEDNRCELELFSSGLKDLVTIRI